MHPHTYRPWNVELTNWRKKIRLIAKPWVYHRHLVHPSVEVQLVKITQIMMRTNRQSLIAASPLALPRHVLAPRTVLTASCLHSILLQQSRFTLSGPLLAIRQPFRQLQRRSLRALTPGNLDAESHAMRFNKISTVSHPITQVPTNICAPLPACTHNHTTTRTYRTLSGIPFIPIASTHSGTWDLRKVANSLDIPVRNRLTHHIQFNALVIIANYFLPLATHNTCQNRISGFQFLEKN